MSPGDGVSRRAQELRARERRLRDHWQAAQATARRWTAAQDDERQAVGQLLALTTLHWYLLVDRQWPKRRAQAATADAVLVGPGGVFVIDIAGQRGPSAAPDAPTDTLEAMARAVTKATGELGLVPIAVHPLVVRTGGHCAQQRGRVRLLDAQELLPALVIERQRLKPAQARAIAEHLGRAFPAYELASVDAENSPPPSTNPDPEGLFTLDSVKDEALQAALAAPIENWMTFLAPDQLALVKRNWGGPARISGPAGTGKTVVGLHRAAHLAQRTTGRVLYVTFAKNLPRVQGTFLHTMAPYVCERVDFRSLFGFAQEFLRERRIPVRLNRKMAETGFNRAWSRVGKNSRLNERVPDVRYWQDEVAYVIKGRGITTFDTYAALPRRGRGRGTVPQRADRAAVWDLFETYEEIRQQYGVHDFQDVLLLALAELRRAPEASRYASVIVDEAQDLPQIGVQMLHALVGDAPNGLLLIGDGQQAVYPGGFRLGEAGVDVRGDRGQVLRTNYRNAPQILAAALEVVADVPFDDLDGTSGRGARDVELTCHDGVVTTVVRPTPGEHDKELVDSLKANDDWPGSAVLCPTRHAINHYRRLLTHAGIPVCLLEDYDGTPVDAVKLGSYTRAKGLDFKRVYLPRHDEALKNAVNGTGSEDDGSQAAARERHQLARSQLYVAMTRARDALWLGTVRPKSRS